MATERYRRNAIAVIRDNYGNEVTDHDSMAGFFGENIKREWVNQNLFPCNLIWIKSFIEWIDYMT
jgi:hypothetical protein